MTLTSNFDVNQKVWTCLHSSGKPVSSSGKPVSIVEANIKEVSCSSNPVVGVMYKIEYTIPGKGAGSGLVVFDVAQKYVFPNVAEAFKYLISESSSKLDGNPVDWDYFLKASSRAGG